MTNINARSLNDRINNLAKKLGVKDTNKLTTILALERVAARLLGRSALRDQLVFHGGFVMLKNYDSPRFTVDLDAFMSSVTIKKLREEVETALETDLEDGFVFWDVTCETLGMKSAYAGVRFKFYYKTGELPGARSSRSHYPRLHLDISIDELRSAPPVLADLRSELDLFEPMSWHIYPPEFIVADKLHATFSRKGQSTRAKDIFDLSILLPMIEDVPALLAGVEQVFGSLKTDIPDSFHSELASYPTEIFESVWGSAVEFKTAATFQKSLSIVLEHLKRIDSFRS